MNRWSPAQFLGDSPPSFFGLRATPLTLGHVWLLDEIGVSASLENGSDVILAAFVVSQSHKASRKDICKRWVRWLLWFLSYRATKRGTLHDEIDRFVKWYSEQHTGPSAKVTRKATDKPRPQMAAPFHFNMTSQLMGTLGMTFDDACNTTVKRAKQLLCAYHESRGEVSLWTEAEYEFDERCRRADEARRLEREKQEAEA